jgi:NDP-sugar pyrophosphorylase family protein
MMIILVIADIFRQGIYGLNSGALGVLKHCMERQESRMRNFQRALIREGQHLRAYPFTKVLDIDHATDIQKAEDFFTMKKTLALYRDPRFSTKFCGER